MRALSTSAAGRTSVRQLSVFVLCVLAWPPPVAWTAPAQRDTAEAEVHVREEGGVYRVAATFDIDAPADVVLDVLRDYESIPRFMPQVRRSIVLARSEGRIIVEQEAVSEFLFFSKQVYLTLEVREEDRAIVFRDLNGRSFELYEGSWQADPREGATILTYTLAAKPGFDVPEFLLKRLLKRDSNQMITMLRQEIARRALSMLHSPNHKGCGAQPYLSPRPSTACTPDLMSAAARTQHGRAWPSAGR